MTLLLRQVEFSNTPESLVFLIRETVEGAWTPDMGAGGRRVQQSPPEAPKRVSIGRLASFLLSLIPCVRVTD